MRNSNRENSRSYRKERIFHSSSGRSTRSGRVPMVGGRGKMPTARRLLLWGNLSASLSPAPRGVYPIGTNGTRGHRSAHRDDQWDTNGEEPRRKTGEKPSGMPSSRHKTSLDVVTRKRLSRIGRSPSRRALNERGTSRNRHVRQTNALPSEVREAPEGDRRANQSMPNTHERPPVNEQLQPSVPSRFTENNNKTCGRTPEGDLFTIDSLRHGSRELKSPRGPLLLPPQSYSRSRHLRVKMKNGRGGWNVRASALARNTFNPIRSIVENLRLAPHPDKPMIALSIGDPTIFGNLKPPQEAVEAVCASVQSMKYNGYAPSVGYPEAREAVAKYCSTPTSVVDAKDVILCSGCSHALDLCISVLGNPGKNILVPRPGFSIYRTLAEGLGLKVKSYDLLPEQGWEADLEQMESQLDADTVAIIVNNPSNPCGSVFSKEHLLKILDIARRNYVPIIADEIYDHFVFPGREFYSLGSLSEDVPILTCGGLTKRFLVPGWRMGWIVVHDKTGVFDQEIRKGLNCLSQRIIGSNTLVQGALPAILSNTPTEFFKETLSAIQGNAEIAYEILNRIPGLSPIMPEGAMYMMVGIDMEKFPEFKTDLEFVEQMVTEESVFCLPGKCFDYPNYVRIVLTVPEAQMREACERMEDFCSRHFQVFEEEEMDMMDIITYEEDDGRKIREHNALFEEKIFLTADGNVNEEDCLINKVHLMSDEGRRP